MFKSKEYKKQYYKQYNINRRELRRQYRVDHRDNIKQYNAQYYLNHQEHKKEYDKQYYIDHQEHIKQKCKQYSLNHRGHFNQYDREWRANHPERARKTNARHFNKRKRNLGFNPLNKSFDGAVAHHINRIDVIYIPGELHKSISHCLETGRNMKKINRFAINFMNKGIEVSR